MPFKMPFFSSTRKHKGQDYNNLKNDCKKKGNLFIDTEFPPDDRSVFHTQGKLAGVVWKRPKQICDNPKLFVEGASAGDVTQGRIGNCWFVSAASCLAQNEEIWHNVIPNYKEQDWNEDKPDDYQGIFYFRFWRYGEWLEVVIDDFLPTVNDELIFIHSQSKNEFWSALLEKAYAKLFGCYEALDGGDLGEALEDFTGGVSEQIDLVKMGVADNPEERAILYKKFGKEMERNSLMAASIPALSSDEMESATSTGLVKGHAYGITAVKNIHLENQTFFSRLFKSDNKIPMIRLRNPWGQGEWKGAFSDGSDEWNKIPEEEKKRVGLTFEEDGEFWMSFDDYCQNFVHTAVCRVVNTSMFSINKTWHEGSAHGEWKKPDRAGGCANNRDTFLQNPQFLFDIKDAEDDVMFHLLQKTIRGKEGSDNLTVGFTIIQVEENRRYRIHDLTQHTIVTSTVFKNQRSIFLKHNLKQGRYVAVTCTFDQGLEESFLFRIYSANANDFKSLLHDKPQKSFLNCCASTPQMVTKVKVIRAEGLERQERTGADPYCIISCEGEKVRTKTASDTTAPEWNQSAVFFRTKPNKPLKIQIWNHNILKDTYMGKHVFMSTDDMKDSIVSVDLVGQGKQGDQQRPGKLTVMITQSRNFSAI
ncbi:calpain-5-like [Mytilus californianus]|uniref:calpain-5-like n=1 Tax=Mytilus californianus TaxID=6549 RepID=UPI0022465B7E|nr:calpain-5-like [Mytilus californianus]